MALPSSVRLVEVGPRDGLQNEQAFVPTHLKLAFIKRLVEAGCANIEAVRTLCRLAGCRKWPTIGK